MKFIQRPVSRKKRGNGPYQYGPAKNPCVCLRIPNKKPQKGQPQMKSYTGVGSRRTPQDILDVMQQVAEKVAREGWVLRSGGAEGADKAFELGCGDGPAEIYRPTDADEASLALAAKVHPAWHRCKEWAKKLHARNCFQVLGRDLDDPSAMLICWTPEGATTSVECSIATGGTATAIRLAEMFNVPVRNLKRPDHLQAAIAFLSK